MPAMLGNGNVKKISLLGSTGSIGTQTLDIAEEHPVGGWTSWLTRCLGAVLYGR